MTYFSLGWGRAVLVCSVGVALGCGPAVETGAGGAKDGSSTSSAVSGATSPGTSGMDSAPGTTPTSSPSNPTQPDTTATTGEPPLTTGSTSEGDGDTLDDDGCNFLCDPDGGTVAFECDLLLQDCARGEKCSSWANDGGFSWNATKCVPVDTDPDAVGEPCTVEGNAVSGIDSCDASSMCFGVDSETNIGECYAFCEGDWEAPTCDVGSQCLISGDTSLVICIPTCDPSVPTSCDADEVCVPQNGNFSCAPATELEGGLLAPCEFVNACDAGLFCANASVLDACEDETGCCTPFCTLEEPDCPGTTACEAYFGEGEAPVGLEHVGVCIND